MHGRDNIKATRKGSLKLGKADLVALARKYGTPLYVMDEDYMRGQCREYLRAFRSRVPDTEVLYASKAFLTLAMAALVRQEGLSIDVVSGNELICALKAGFDPSCIHFHGNNKTPYELKQGLEAGIGRFIVDNFDELELLDRLAGEAGKKAHIMLRLAPGVEAHTHKYIQTGQTDSKFGLAIADGRADAALDLALSLKNVKLHGFHCHIGSQIFDIEAYRLAAEKMVGFAASAQKRTGFLCEELNLGGGLGVRYTEKDSPRSIDELAEVICSAVKSESKRHGLKLPKLMVEPGRSIVGEAGLTLYTIGAIKDVPGIRTYASVDGGMTDNPRVALYQAEYDAIVANKARQKATRLYTIAGNACESGDMLIWDIKLPELEAGDLLAVLTTGAYNYSMSSHYNMHAKPPVVFVRGGRAQVVVRGETYKDIMRPQLLPERFRK
ncbi:MAG TPA: diaminopimelate decarboxylase [Bacillota bacterium]|nr:diaminopimelate decarboxylase [Bacillota bacterium]